MPAASDQTGFSREDIYIYMYICIYENLHTPPPPTSLCEFPEDVPDDERSRCSVRSVRGFGEHSVEVLTEASADRRVAASSYYAVQGRAQPPWQLAVAKDRLQCPVLEDLQLSPADVQRHLGSAIGKSGGRDAAEKGCPSTEDHGVRE